jgi:hypothetical protein
MIDNYLVAYFMQEKFKFTTDEIISGLWPDTGGFHGKFSLLQFRLKIRKDKVILHFIETLKRQFNINRFLKGKKKRKGR